jgi:hypothetical protein
MKENHYRHLLAMAALSFGAMYILMYAMVNTIADVHMNVNQFYMAGLMTAPMILIELLVMRGMYPRRRLNALIIAGSVVAGLAMFLFISSRVNGGRLIRWSSNSVIWNGNEGASEQTRP